MLAMDRRQGQERLRRPCAQEHPLACAPRRLGARARGSPPSVSVHLLHGCDTPAFCRPESPAHLRPRTPADNAADQLARHRDALLARLRLEAAGRLTLAVYSEPDNSALPVD